MHERLVRPVLGSIAVAAIAVASLVVADHAQPSSTSQESPAMIASADEVGPFCPSAQQVREHWDNYDEELKPDSECPDLEPAADPDQSPAEQAPQHEHSEGDAPPAISTIADAQATLDPEDEG